MQYEIFDDFKDGMVLTAIPLSWFRSVTNFIKNIDFKAIGEKLMGVLAKIDFPALANKVIGLLEKAIVAIIGAVK